MRRVLVVLLALPAALAAGPVAASKATPSERICFDVAGAPGTLAIVNLTPVEATAPGNGQLISSDVATPPEASNVNFAPGTVDPNVAVAKVGADGTVCFVNSVHGNVHVIADDLGALAATAFTATSTGAPVRRVDTRAGLGGDVVAASERRCFTVGGDPGDVALVNLTPVGATRAGNGVLVPDDASTATPTASNVNFGPGTVDPNVALATIGASNKVCFVNSVHGPVHLIADELGTIEQAVAKPAATGGVPKRVADTRLGIAGGMVVPSGRACFAVAGSPGDVAIVNLTPVDATRAGFGQLVSSSVTTPAVSSNVNFDRRTVDPNVAAAVIGTDNQVCFVNSVHAAVHLVADHLMTVAGSAYTPPSATGSPKRVLDTRPVGTVVSSSATVMPTVIDCLNSDGCVAAVDTSPVRGLTVTATAATLGTAPATAPATPSPATSLECALTDKCFAASTSEQVGGERVASLHMTTNRGSTWSATTLPRQVDALWDLSCASSIRCLAAGYDLAAGAVTGALFATSNGGTSWTEIALPATVDQITAIDCPGGTVCLMIAKDGEAADGSSPARILRSTDAGATWTTVSTPTGAPGELQCPTSTTCLAFTTSASGQTVRHLSGDGGLSWSARPLDVTGTIVRVDCPSTDRCVAAGDFGAVRAGDATVLVSTDQFTTWTATTIPSGGTSPDAETTDVSCSSTSACFVTGRYAAGGGFVATLSVA